EQRCAEVPHLAEHDVGRPVHYVADNHAALIRGEAERAAEVMSQRAADHQADAGAYPDIADPLGAAIEYQLSEQAEQNLRRCAGRKLPFSRRSREIDSAENRNERALNRNAGLNPILATIAPAVKVPMVSVAHAVVWVMELAVCISSRVVMVGRMADLPLVKKG